METVEPIRSMEKIRQIEDYLRRRSERDWMLFVTGCNSGLRISDLRRLRAGDVQGTHLTMRTKKTGKRVQVAITDRLAQAFKTYTAKMAPGDYLFPSRKGWNQPLTRSACYRIIKRAAEACGVKRIGTHSMRKSFGWHFYQYNKDIASLMELYGHQSLDVTQRYIGLLQDNLDDVMKGFSV